MDVTGKRTLAALALALVAASLASPAAAEDVAKKWRISMAVGGYNANDEINSAAANELFIVNSCLRNNTCELGEDLLTAIYRDPRNDSAVFGNLDLQPALIGTVAVQYGVHASNSATFVVEGSVGYQVGDVGDVEVSAQFIGNASELDEIPFNYTFFRMPAGELTRVPIQLTALARFRPRATFNPYVGVGVGYSIIGFDVSPELNELSLNMDSSKGVQMRLTNAIFGQGSAVTDNFPAEDLEGATVDAGDTFEWHLAGGVELSIKRKWSLFVDVRWVDASRSMHIGFNGSDELGVSVQTFVDFDDSERALTRYGPVLIGSCPKGSPCSGDGLIDVGRVILSPDEDAPPGLDCEASPQDANCIIDFIFEPDGILDAAQYYVQGGEINYDGFQAQFGFRYTF